MKADLLIKILSFQRNEITEYHIYKRLARTIPEGENRAAFEKISREEMQHYQFWYAHTQKLIKPSRWQIWKYYLISRLLGFTFGVKLMEKDEEAAQSDYEAMRDVIPGVEALIRDEQDHEQRLLQLLNEEKLQYMGSIVLGLNDALVELTGALAGLTLALQNTRLIALAGSITGIAAAMSMAASEYLSTKSEETQRSPLKSSFYTGAAYIFTVLLLISPYLFVENYYICLGLTLGLAVIIIALFNYYISVARDLPFKARFLEMTALSFAVALFSFGIGYLIRRFMGIEV
jgi:VIT1/CCC1 family predicted Fe2+/Mn2+ transporter